MSFFEFLTDFLSVGCVLSVGRALCTFLVIPSFTLQVLGCGD